jgi:hypothetical protein
MAQFTKKQTNDLQILARFIQLYCCAKHGRAARQPFALPAELEGAFHHGLSLCADCAGLLSHGVAKRRACPLEPKPTCKNCHIHCYSKDYRAKIREIMAFSGRRLIMRGRLDYLWHYFF